MAKKDQYDNPIPTDLVLLPSADMLADGEVATVVTSDWYEAKGVLMASAKALKGLSEDDPLDAGIDLSRPETEVLCVADCLKRYGPEDGFYHA